MPDLTTVPRALVRPILATLVDHAGEALIHVAEILRPGDSPSPVPFASEPCPCGQDHPPLPGPLALLHQIRTEQAAIAEPEPVDGPLDEPAWVPSFADAVRETQTIALPGVEHRGRPRPLMVAQVRRREPEWGFGPGMIALLLVDTVSGDVLSPTVSVDQGLQIAVTVPDSVPEGLAGGAR